MTNLPQTSLVSRLRAEFDGSFAECERAVTENFLELLGFSVGDGRYAVRLEQVAAVHEMVNVTRTPGELPGLEGLVAVQGLLVAVYDLAYLLRAPGNALARRWLLVCREERQLGFAVDTIDGYLRRSTDALVATSDAAQHNGAVTSAIVEETSARLVVDFGTLIKNVRHQFRTVGQEAR